jgi:hypothetical protein
VLVKKKAQEQKGDSKSESTRNEPNMIAYVWGDNEFVRHRRSPRAVAWRGSLTGACAME